MAKKMTLSKIAFKAIDVLYKVPQNPQKVLRENSDGVLSEKNVVFDDSIPTIMLDVYHVESEGKYPVIFEIHGGGFSAGDKQYRTALCTWFAKQTGAYVFNVNYGLGSDYVFPDPLIHLIKAFNWVVANAEKYNLDLDHMIVTGDSAGAYYSSALSVYNDSLPMQEACKIPMNGRFTGAVLNCGLYDLKRALSTKAPFNLTSQVCEDFAGIPLSKYDSYQYRDAVDPLLFATENFPKTLVIYSEHDIFCGGQGEALVKKLNELGVYEEHYGSKKLWDNHTFSLTWASSASKEANAQIISFMNRLFADEI